VARVTVAVAGADEWDGDRIHKLPKSGASNAV